MKKIIYIYVLLFAISSCNYEEPLVSGYSNFKFGKLEGKSVDVSFDATVENENGFGFKIKKGDLNLFINDLDLGKIHLNDKIKIKRKSENIYTIPLKLSLSDGVLFRLPKLVTATKFELKLEGTVRGSVMGFGKNFKIKETKNLSSGDIKFDGLLEGIMKGR